MRESGQISVTRFLITYGLLLLSGGVVLMLWRDSFWTYRFLWAYGWLRPRAWVTSASLLSPDIIRASISIVAWVVLGVVLWRAPASRKWLARLFKVASYAVFALPICIMLLIGLYGKERYDFVMSRVGKLREMVSLLGDIGAPRPLVAPFDFVFIDEGRVAEMHVQFVPALREQQRTVQTQGTAGVEAKVGGAAASIGASASQQRAETSQLQAVSPSLHRNASELIVGLAQSGQVRIYKDSGGWIVQKLADPLRAVTQVLESVVEDGNYAGTLPSAEEIAAELKIDRLQSEMKTELSELAGQVVVEGRWQVSRPGDGTVLLEHSFYPEEHKGRDLVFQCVVPATAVGDRSGAVFYRVFGTVVSSESGQIERSDHSRCSIDRLVAAVWQGRMGRLLLAPPSWPSHRSTGSNPNVGGMMMSWPPSVSKRKCLFG